VILKLGYPFGSCTSRATKKVITCFHSMPDDLRSASGANGRKHSDSAFKAIKGIGFVIHHDFKGFLVSISALVTSFHKRSLDWTKDARFWKGLKVAGQPY
jgi:hypothetical protein